MDTKNSTRELLKELRKLERQAKQLIYKMNKIELDWKHLQKELHAAGVKQLPNTLGDAIANWHKLKNFQ